MTPLTIDFVVMYFSKATWLVSTDYSLAELASDGTSSQPMVPIPGVSNKDLLTHLDGHAS